MKPKRITVNVRTRRGPFKLRAPMVDIVPWAKTVIHRAIDIEYDNPIITLDKFKWTVTEATTGYGVAIGLWSREEAIEEATHMLKKCGKTKFNRILKKVTI